MPKRRRSFHRAAAAFMCVLFTGCIAIAGMLAVQASRDPLNIPMLLFSFVFGAMGIGQIAGMVWYQRRIVIAFEYDGRRFCYRALSTGQIPADEIAAVREWTGRGGPQGYCLVSRNGKKLYIEYTVSNAAALAENIRCHTPHSAD